MAEKRIVAAKIDGGRIVAVEEDVPPLRDGAVLIEVHNSLISPGTELQGGWRALAAQPREPKPGAPRKTFGYSNAGVALEVGKGVAGIKPGDRVVCVGAGFAQHATRAVVPHNLTMPLPDNLSFAQGSYAMLAATALHALRRGTPAFGESVAVVGLGLVGQLGAQLHQLAGNYVIGWDTIDPRLEIARGNGIHETVNVLKEDPVEKCKAFTNQYGLDAGLVAVPGDSSKPFDQLYHSMKCSPDGHYMGTIVIVGGTTFPYPDSANHNLDIRRAARTGPGYHDSDWEFGAPYPPVFMRWTTRTNLELCLRLISEGRLQVDSLTSHTIALADCEAGVNEILDDPDSILGVVFKMK